jgi:exonuclease SbcC
MISRILLRNFQKHRKLDLKLDQVTTLIGPSDVGKSAVIRALRWVMTNTPRGNSFMRHGAKKCSVTIWVDDHKIKRIKSGTTNTYVMDGHTYHSFATGVPEPIQNVLKIYDENFQAQHDNVFWLSLSPAEASKRLNEIADLQIMDDSIRKVLSIKKEAEHRVKFSREQREAAKKLKAELSFVPEMIAAYNKLQRLEDFVVSSHATRTRLIGFTRSLDTATQTATEIETWLVRAEPLKQLESELEQSKENRLKLAKMIKVARQYAEIPSEEDMGWLKGDLAILEKDLVKFKNLGLIIRDLKNYSKEVSQCQSRLQTLKGSLSKTSAICPECGRPM